MPCNTIPVAESKLLDHTKKLNGKSRKKIAPQLLEPEHVSCRLGVKTGNIENIDHVANVSCRGLRGRVLNANSESVTHTEIVPIYESTLG